MADVVDGIELCCMKERGRDKGDDREGYYNLLI